jgi:hypothetical protein
MSADTSRTTGKHWAITVGADGTGELSETRVYGICMTISIFWICCGLAYFFARPANFLRMWPEEFGSLLSGWVAPLAVLWLFAAVLLQRSQLQAQHLELKQTSEGLRRSVAELENSATQAQLTRLSERLMHCVLRIARTGSAREFYLEKGVQRIDAAHFLGSYRRYAELFKANEVSRALELLSKGMEMLVLRINGDWVLHADTERTEDLAAELSSLINIVSQLERLAPKIEASQAGETGPDPAILRSCRKRAVEAQEMLDAMLRELRNFDVPEGTISSPGL